MRIYLLARLRERFEMGMGTVLSVAVLTAGSGSAGYPRDTAEIHRRASGGRSETVRLCNDLGRVAQR